MPELTPFHSAGRAASQDSLVQQISGVLAQLASLRERYDPAEAIEGEMLGEALDELHESLEEVMAINDELTLTRGDLERERQRYQELFSCAPVAYLVTDRHGTIREANRAAGALLGVAPNLLRQKPLVVFVPLEERQAFRSSFDRVLAGGETSGWRTCLRPWQGQPIDVEVTVVAASTGGPGSPPDVLWIVRDVADRRRFDDARAQLIREQTARIVSDVTLRQSHAFLVVATRAIKTPLTSILGNAQLMLGRIARTPGAGWEQPIVDAFKAIERAAFRIARLTDTMVDFAYLQEGSIVLRRVPTDVADLLQRARRAAQNQPGRSDLVFDVRTEPIVALVDPLRLRRVVAALIDAAARDLPSTGRVTISLARASSDTWRLRVVGQGLRRSGEERRTFAEGLAARLGEEWDLDVELYVARGIVELHAGQLTVEFPDEESLQFSLTLPIGDVGRFG